MQSVRTAGQKQIAQSISIQATTLVRFLFGLPFAALYFLALAYSLGDGPIAFTSYFFLSATLAAVSQIFATVCLVNAITVKNFAVGTALAKTEALLTAILGAWFFSAALSFLGYVSVVVGVVGVLVASNWKITLQDLVDNKSIKYGLGAGLGFALASLWLREASLELTIPVLLSAAATLLYMVMLQTAICLAWIVAKEREQLRLIGENLRASTFIGFTSVAGSVGWFTAISLQEAALVKTLGQMEFVVTLLITYLYFGERISVREYSGMALVIVSILFLLRAS
ncbi:MAG: DMT family transporter [Gammaproteobacteria bacterium]|nr:DMT family transporter [Gammaproteobacteria bacterium]